MVSLRSDSYADCLGGHFTPLLKQLVRTPIKERTTKYRGPFNQPLCGLCLEQFQGGNLGSVYGQRPGLLVQGIGPEFGRNESFDSGANGCFNHACLGSETRSTDSD